jgi:hypothetical protein
LTGERAFFLEGLQVAGDGEGAGETEVRLDLAQRGEDLVLLAMRVHEIEHSLLAIG